MLSGKKEKRIIVDIAIPKPLLKNPRTHSQRNLEDISKSLLEHGQVTPIVVDRDGFVRKGNGTLQAAKSLGWKLIWVVPYSEAFNGPGEEAEDDKRLRMYTLQDNRTSETSEWDLKILQEDFKWLQGADVIIDDIGWMPHEAEPILAAEWSPPKDDGIGDSDGGGPPPDMAPPIAVTIEQRAVFEQAMDRVHERTGGSESEGRCLELICAEYLA